MQNLDQKGLAKRWLISPRTLEQWRWQGCGPRFLKLGGRVLYRLADVEAYEADNLHFQHRRSVRKWRRRRPWSWLLLTPSPRPSAGGRL